MTEFIFIISIVLATAFGFAHYSDAEFTDTHESEIFQLSLVGVCAILLLYAIFSTSFLLFCLEFAGIAIGLGLGRGAAVLFKKYGKRFYSEETDNASM